MTRYILGTNGDKTPILIDLNAGKCDVQAVKSIYNLIKTIKNPTFIIASGEINAITSVILFAVKKENRFAFKNSDIYIDTIPQVLFGFNSEISKANTYIYERLSEDTSLDKEMLKKTFLDEEDDNFYFGIAELLDSNDIKIINDLTEIYDL